MSEALQLADSAHVSHRVGWQRKAAAELRRLVAENEALKADTKSLATMSNLWAKEKALNAELVEALRGIVEFVDGPVEGQRPDVWERRAATARAALAKVQGESE